MKKIRKKKKGESLLSDSTQAPFFPKIQKKISVGKAGDKYEVEADAMADAVVAKQSESTSIQKKGADEEIQEKPLSEQVTSLQKQELKEEDSIQKAEEEKEESVQKMEEEETVQEQEEEETVQEQEEEETVQKQEEEETVQEQEEEETVQEQEEEEIQEKTAGIAPKRNIETQLKKSKGKGQTIDAKTRMEMEQGFGADFSNVKIHTDSEAENLSNDLGAQAFTTGNDIYFNEGKYDPNSKEGKHLLAHELTHTIQQNGANAIQKNSKKKSEEKLPVCEGKEDISELVKKLKSKAITAIDSSSLSNTEKDAKKLTVNAILQDEGIFSVSVTKFYACDKINLPALSGAGGNGFNGYSDASTNEMGGLKSFKKDIKKVLAKGNLDALLTVLKLIGHEKRHLTLSGMPTIEDSDILPGNTESNAVELSSYLVEEILVNAEEIAINHRYENGNYVVPLSLSAEIRRYWRKIENMVTPTKALELKKYITKELETRYSSKNRANAISRGILNAMERGNWNHHP